jgi:hypothetical protein
MIFHEVWTQVGALSQPKTGARTLGNVVESRSCAGRIKLEVKPLFFI